MHAIPCFPASRLDRLQAPVVNRIDKGDLVKIEGICTNNIEVAKKTSFFFENV